jgi:XRE family transcriptional regulator, fatty acid utilization regulator
LSSPLNSQHPTIGQTVRHFRAEARLTQEELADAVEVHPTEISRLENGHREPKWETMKRLAKGLGITCPEMVAFAERLDQKRERRD